MARIDPELSKRSKNTEMAQNGQKGPGSTEKDRNGPKRPRMAQNGPEWPGMTQNIDGFLPISPKIVCKKSQKQQKSQNDQK